MASDAAKLLDELMGRNRNLAPSERPNLSLQFEDPEVCKHYLVSFCPHDLFVNTRADLGTCDKVHDEDLRKKYEKSSRNGRLGFEEDFLSFLQSLLSDVEKRIVKGRARLALNAQANMGGVHGQKEEKIEMLSQRINDLVEQAEDLGCQGKVEEAQGVLKLCEQLKDEREQLSNVSNFHQTLQPKEMEVCEVCGAFLVMGDAQQRVEEHLMGKQHIGYGKVRDTIDKLKRKLRGEPTAEEVERRNKEREERDKERQKEREERDKEREKRRKEREERDKERAKEREERDKEREKEREERRRRRSRSRSRSRGHRRRSRSRDRRRRSRSRDRRRSRSRDRRGSRRSRSRDRRRSRDRSRRSSRDKDRRSRDKSRGKSRDKSRGKSRDKSDSRRSSEKCKSESKKEKEKHKEEETKSESKAEANGEVESKIESQPENENQTEIENQQQTENQVDEEQESVQKEQDPVKEEEESMQATGNPQQEKMPEAEPEQTTESADVPMETGDEEKTE